MKIKGLFFGLLCVYTLTLANTWKKTPTHSTQENKRLEWVIDPLKSKVKFTAQNMGLFNVDGEFLNYEGAIYSDSTDFMNPAIEFTIFTNSITTDNAKRDKHLKSSDFFNVEKFPEIKFESDKLEKVDNNKYLLIGKLTILGHTRSEYFQVTRYPEQSKRKLSFRIRGEIDRQLYGLRFKEGISDDLVGDQVEIDISIHLTRAE